MNQPKMQPLLISGTLEVLSGGPNPTLGSPGKLLGMHSV